MSIDTSNNMDEYLKRQAAAAAGAGAAAASASTAASVAGQKQESAQGAVMATAANTAAAPAAKPSVDPVSGLPIKPAGTPTTVQTAKVPIPTGMDAPETKPFSTQAGDNVGAYINKVSSTLGGDPGYTTEAGRLAAERVTNGLKTPDASSVNAQNTEDTAASRRAYLARVAADESIGQSGFGAGTAQADRIRTTSAAGVNQANQAGQSGVNAYLRQRTEDNLNRAQGLERDQYGKGRDNLADAERFDLNQYGRSEKATDRGLAAAATAYSQGRDARRDSEYDASTAYNQGRDAIGDAKAERTYQDSRTDKALDNSRWDTLNAQQQAQLAVENAAVASGKDDTAKRNLLAGLPDGPAKNKVMAGLADGSLTLQNALNSVMNPDGSIKEEYHGSTPGALGLEAEKEYAEQTVSLQDPSLKLSNPQEYEKRVAAEILSNRNAKNQPINDATDAAELKAIQAKINTGATLSDAEIKQAIEGGVIASVSSLKTKADGNAQVGKMITFGDGTVGKVTASNDNRGEPYIDIQVDGKTIQYHPTRAQYHVYVGGKDLFFASKDEALARLNGGK